MLAKKRLKPAASSVKKTQLQARKKFDLMMRNFGLSPKQVSGRTILDLGAGSRLLERRGTKEKTNSRIFSMDRDKSRLVKVVKGGRSIVGKGEALPIQSNKFDHVVSRLAVPYVAGFSGSSIDIARSLIEMLRVVKPGGSIRINPYYKGDAENNWVERLNKFSRRNFLEAIKETNFRVRVLNPNKSFPTLIIYKYKKSDLGKLRKALLKE